ncbi:MAG: hypothetical protein E7456_02785 [Ruminococcaceae bacterium]|nr:hypothetical protein [Oscillospiraceae bacterium]
MKKHFIRWISCALILCILFSIPVTATAASTLPDSIYLQQESGLCTLTSATMMIRSRMYLSNNNKWVLVTTNDVRTYGWLNGVGLYWNWTYTLDDCRINVRREIVEGITTEDLKAVLDAHPEGIVLYVTSVPHAVFLTDYEGDTFYCADPSPYYSGKRIPLSESYTASRVGDQDAVLAATYSYWYVNSYSIPEYTDEVIPPMDIPSECSCTEDLAGQYRCIASDALNIRSRHDTASPVLGTIPSGAVVTVTRANGEWAHVEYNGISGYAYMQYLEEVVVKGDIDGDTHVSNADIVTLVRYLVGMYEEGSETYYRVVRYGDVNRDGRINNTDLLEIAIITVNS